MKTMTVALSLLAFACAEDPTADAALRLWSNVGLVAATDYETSTIDAFALDDPDRMSRNLVLAAGDAVVRRIGEEALVVNRGAASNIQVLTRDLTPGVQVALPGCGPHDALLLPDGRVLVTCYDHTRMRVVDLDTEAVSDGPDLSAFADADGLPEMDQLILAGGRVLVTVQQFNNLTFTPAGPGLVVAIDPTTLALVDADPGTAGVQAHALPFANPYTRVHLDPQGRVIVGCAGDWATYAGMGVVALDPQTFATTVLADGSALGGPPTEVAVSPAGEAFAVVLTPDGLALENMVAHVKRIDGATATSLHAASGYSLAGLAAAASGEIFFGNRKDDASAGLWVVAPGGEVGGPIATTLPPFDIEL